MSAAFSSPVVTMRTPGFSVPIRATIADAKELYLIVTDGGNGYACDWADWAEPTLVSAFGKKTKLTNLAWASATTDWGKVRIGKNAGNGPLKVKGQPVEFGIGTHANSVITYKLPAGHSYAWFTARGALDNGGTDQNGTSVQFHVYTEKPDLVTLLAKAKKTNETKQVGAQDPKSAVANLTIHPKLQAQLFAAEPMLLNPSNIDIDHRGRIWVCEVVNYRKHKGTRKEGDRILILEDTDGDAKADKSTTFFQGTEVDTAHGVTVLPTANGKNTKVIVAVGDKILVFHDTNGDDKADKFEPLFTGISGTQHDHGIHQVQFGPDGRFYFNFGNSGRQIKDAKGKPVVDLQGNEVNNQRKPYQEGMVFRCYPDGSEFETLGWNFRNNWMVTVDSFGTMWQSDNDDDGNKGVRINYVMEHGNYGYKDELTGAGWRAKRTGMHAEIPKRHWHLNDPGVVPNVLQTGAGSPTGICIYEGDLLPKEFQGQMIHCDAGPSVVRAYPVENDGAGYKATTVNILEGTKDRWFRPSDVKVAPDGSLIAADWYDPGVGGHNARHIDSGRLFRVAPTGNSDYQIDTFDFNSVNGCITALKNPNNAVRYIAWNELHKQQAKAKPALEKLARDKNPRFRARALWLLAMIKGNVPTTIKIASRDRDPNIRLMALRLARQHTALQKSLLTNLVRDRSPQVRREILITLADKQAADPNVFLWTQLANQHDGKDRWYLEALGIAARGHEAACLDAWLQQTENWNTPAGHDIIWRLRAPKAATYLAKILTDPKTTAADKDRYMRALDFIPKCQEKDDALAAIALGSLGL
ncbi:MAG: PVC-type heme-binding CxxCH protein [Limisphaerales bacterium]